MKVNGGRLFDVKLRWCRTGSATRLNIVSLLLVFPVLVSPRAAAAQGSNEIETAVVFYADPGVEASVWPSLVDAFRNEVLQEANEYPLPTDAEPIRGSSVAQGQEFGKIIQVHLIGRCDVVEQAQRPVTRGPLGWVLDVSGEIQPFVYINCDRVAQFLNPTTLGMNDDQRREAMARAISRIAIHEWIHIDAQSARHASHGIRQAELSGAELTGGSAGGR
jgi:hypothetical protein